MSAASSALVNEIRAASRKLVREFGFLDKTIADTDLSGSAVHAILEIGLAPGITAKELSTRLKLEKSTISRLLKMLESRGEIFQARSDTDGRSLTLGLTQAGRETLDQINRFGDNQARRALSRVDDVPAETVANALSAYADALSDAPRKAKAPLDLEIVEGYQTGMIGDVAALHGRTHGPIVGNGPFFESVVAAAMAEFMPRLDRPVNKSWCVLDDRRVIGTITIDGEDLEGNVAHLRWFILSESLRGQGLGQQLLKRALDHCDGLGFDEIHLWTLKGLDAARALYEKHGFELTDEYIGDQWGKAVTEQKFVRKRP